MSGTEAWLNAGIAALKAGNRAEARRLLRQVIEADEQHERAWLWLSGAVETGEERPICLENVLAIGPANVAARKGSEGLAAGEEKEEGGGAVNAYLGAMAASLGLITLLFVSADLLYGVARAAPEFERVQVHQLARVQPGLTTADQYHELAKRLERNGLLAAAALHWQRAAAREPTRGVYLRRLAEVYARLGFDARALDMLQSALRVTSHPEVRAEIEAMLAKLPGKNRERRWAQK